MGNVNNIRKALIEFDEQISIEKGVKCYSYNNHEKLFQKVLERVDRHTSFFFSTFALQKWCAKQRRKASLDLRELTKGRIYMGVNQKYDPLSIQEKVLKTTNEVLNFIDKIIENEENFLEENEVKALKEVLYEEETGISDYLLTKSLKTAMDKISFKYRKYFKNRYVKIHDLYLSLEGNIKYVYHDSDTLLNLYIYSRKKEDEYYMFRRQTERIIDSFKFYPFLDGVLPVLNEIADGKNILTVANEMDRDFKYVKKRVEEAKKVFEVFLWGYFC